ncbi:MFS transporter, DHA1 family, bicyclomycin/chloramphenicol resistance protein [Arboricoccus pini]|uniref:MFS transporter, DHA1 family, bicyclomycin/chloramphenicol resistance protein n=1 Tax=Arboricoccus pini TaxID=1963835 RepID=A0A212R423_9PROT|nr:multidrug effflux MFS transporter [Arboricoccus pini]SNB66568.1 MFS transporter, DHA1 family, bicyclomycin/chloramphenicol resistance protein [Arboricoccus pini]
MRAPQKTPPFPEFVILIAAMMGITSMAMDNLLPAFGPIQASFSVSNPNRLQLIVYAYMLGFGLTQLIYGSLSDVIGRRPALMMGMGVFLFGGVMALLAPNFEILILARVIQGMGAAAGRVLSIAIVRDRFEGREMAKVMSLTMMVFIIVPVFAPALGSLVLLMGSWHWIFVSTLMVGVAFAFWFYLRMPETLHPEYRASSLSLTRILAGVHLTLSSRVAVGYATAMALMMGGLMAYVGSSQQIFETEVYGLGGRFPLVFGLIAVAMSIAALLNSRLVGRLGTRRLSHGGLCGYVLVSLLQVIMALVYKGHPPLLLFAVLVAGNQFLFSIVMPNFNSMAMQPLAAVAGTAASFMGCYTTLAGTLFGYLVGRAFDGTVLPLAFGLLAMGGSGLAIVLWTEKGRLFHPQHEPA